MPEMEYVVQTGSNMKEIHLEADDKHVFTPQLCVHSLSDTQGLFSGTKVYVYAFVCVCTFYRQKLPRDYFIHY